MNKRHQYAPEWFDTIRPAILKRDAYKCRHCGLGHRVRVYKDSRGQYVECDAFTENWAIDHGKRVFTVFLQVAHLNHKKDDNRAENLMTLCPRCHTTFDAAHKAQVRTMLKGQPSEEKTIPRVKYTPKQAALYTAVSEMVHKYTGSRLHLHQAEAIATLILKTQ